MGASGYRYNREGFDEPKMPGSGMTLETKEIIHILTYIITLIAILLVIRSLLFEIRRDAKVVKNIIFGERGSLNVITQEVLKKHLDEIWTKMRQTDKGFEMILNKIDDMDKKLLILMIHEGIKSPDIMKPIDDKKNNQ